MTICPKITKESLLPVCDKPYHTIKENLLQWAELQNLWYYVLLATTFVPCGEMNTVIYCYNKQIIGILAI